MGSSFGPLDIKRGGTDGTTPFSARRALGITSSNLTGVVNVQDDPYNAVGNGTHDDTSAIQLAFNSGHDVWIPAGTYKITSSLTVPTRYGFVVRGEYGVTILNSTFAGAIIKFPAGQDMRYSTIDGIVFKATGAGAGAATGISGAAGGLAYVMFSDIQRCRFSGTLRYGIDGNFITSEISRCTFGVDAASGTFKHIRMKATDLPSNVNRITNCEFNFANDDYAVELEYGSLVVFKGCVFEVNTPTTGVIKIVDYVGFLMDSCWGESNGAVPLVKSIDGAHGTFDTRFAFNSNRLAGNNSGANDVVLDVVSAVGSGNVFTNNVILNYTHITNTSAGYNRQLSAFALYNNKCTGGTPGIYSDGTGLTAYLGTPTNDSAAAGYIGEIISSTVASNTTSLTSTVVASTTSISLTAGDWDVDGVIAFTGNALTTVIQLIGGASSVNNTLGAAGTYADHVISAAGVAIFAAGNPFYTIPIQRFSLSSTTTVYLVIRADFGVNTCTGGGVIRARRVR